MEPPVQSAAPEQPGRGPRIRVCRGCCCGTERKHPGVDHSRIEEILVNESGEASDLVTTECLWQCDRSSIVVVNPSSDGRRRGARPVWVSNVNTLERARTIAAWVRSGVPGIARLPLELDDVNPASIAARTSVMGW